MCSLGRRQAAGDERAFLWTRIWWKPDLGASTAEHDHRVAALPVANNSFAPLRHGLSDGWNRHPKQVQPP